MSSPRTTSGFTRLIVISGLLLASGTAVYFFARGTDKQGASPVPAAATPAAPAPVAAAPAPSPAATPAPTPVAQDKSAVVAASAPVAVTPPPAEVVAATTDKPKRAQTPIPVPIDMAKPAQSPAAQGAVQAPPPMPKKITFTLDDLKAQVPRDKDGNFQLELAELFMATGDRQVATVLDGQKVETIARVVPEKVDNAEGHKVRLFSLVISCCAADAQPITIAADFKDKKAPAFKDMTWVKVRGIMRYKPADNDRLTPVLEATAMEETESQDGKSLF